MCPLLFLSTALAADQAIGREALVLQGRQAENQVVIRGPSEGPLTLHLDLAASERVDPEQSWLTVSLDGVPVRSTSLEQLYQTETTGQWTLQLPAIEAGYHTIGLQSSLWTDEDPCLLRDPDSAWLRVDPSSKLSWTPKQLSGTLPSLVEDWQALGEAVSLVHPVSPSVEGVAALLVAQGLLGSWGLELSVDPQQARLLLLEAEGSPQDAALWPEGVVILAENPAAQAVVDRSGDSLRLMTRTPGEWAAALQGLDTEVLDRCTTTPCILGTLGEPVPREPVSTYTPGTTLVDLGLPRGAVFLGEGAHTMRLPFGRPANSVVTEAPVVDLRVKLPKGVPLQDSTSATLWLGDRPLETWALTGGEQRLIARLPEYAWKDGVWDLRLELRMDPENENCHAIDPKHTWINVGPESGVLLTVEESVFEGISGFERASQANAATLQFNPELSWSQWLLAGQLLATLPLNPLPAEDHCPGPCVDAFTTSLQAPGASLLFRQTAWEDPDTETLLPLSATLNQPALQASDCAAGQCSALRLYLPKSAHSVDLVPPLASLTGHQAVWDGQMWVGLAQDASPAITLARADDAPQTDMATAVSASEAKLQQVDLAMLALLLGVALVGGVWVYTSSKRPELEGPVDIEVT